MSPRTEWDVIGNEQTPTGQLLAGYVMPLAAIGALAGFIGGTVVGRTLPFIGTFRTPFVPGVVGAILTVVMAVAGVCVISVVINALAPTFGARPDGSQSIKVAA